jgi:hypothetical protein
MEDSGGEESAISQQSHQETVNGCELHKFTGSRFCLNMAI